MDNEGVKEWENFKLALGKDVMSVFLFITSAMRQRIKGFLLILVLSAVAGAIVPFVKSSYQSEGFFRLGIPYKGAYSLFGDSTDASSEDRGNAALGLFYGLAPEELKAVMVLLGDSSRYAKFLEYKGGVSSELQKGLTTTAYSMRPLEFIRPVFRFSGDEAIVLSSDSMKAANAVAGFVVTGRGKNPQEAQFSARLMGEYLGDIIRSYYLISMNKRNLDQAQIKLYDIEKLKAGAHYKELDLRREILGIQKVIKKDSVSGRASREGSVIVLDKNLYSVLHVGAQLTSKEIALENLLSTLSESEALSVEIRYFINYALNFEKIILESSSSAEALSRGRVLVGDIAATYLKSKDGSDFSIMRNLITNELDFFEKNFSLGYGFSVLPKEGLLVQPKILSSMVVSLLIGFLLAFTYVLYFRLRQN